MRQSGSGNRVPVTTQVRPIGIPPRDRVGTAGATSGTVKWVDVSRAYGAIETELTGSWEIWFHFSSIEVPGQASLTAGDRVEVRYLGYCARSFSRDLNRSRSDRASRTACGGTVRRWR